MKLIKKQENILGDNIGFVEYYDVSDGNFSYKSRIETVSKIASICYGKDEAKNPEKLFNKLKKESSGLPSSSFEFVPVLLGETEINFIAQLPTAYLNKYPTKPTTSHILKYGEFLYKEGKYQIITNLRAILYDNEKFKDFLHNINLETLFNTENEQKTIKENFYVFKIKMPIFVARQIMRHRVALQEVSRRYTTHKKVPLEFYIQSEVLNITNGMFYEQIEKIYEKLLEEGVKAELARTVLPLSTYTTVWMGFYPSQLDNFLKLRTDKHTQEETRKYALAIQKLIKD